jgi:hypothetical protein
MCREPMISLWFCARRRKAWRQRAGSPEWQGEWNMEPACKDGGLSGGEGAGVGGGNAARDGDGVGGPGGDAPPQRFHSSRLLEWWPEWKTKNAVRGFSFSQLLAFPGFSLSQLEFPLMSDRHCAWTSMDHPAFQSPLLTLSELT